MTDTSLTTRIEGDISKWAYFKGLALAPLHHLFPNYKTVFVATEREGSALLSIEPVNRTITGPLRESSDLLLEQGAEWVKTAIAFVLLAPGLLGMVILTWIDPEDPTQSCDFYFTTKNQTIAVRNQTSDQETIIRQLGLLRNLLEKMKIPLASYTIEIHLNALLNDETQRGIVQQAEGLSITFRGLPLKQHNREASPPTRPAMPIGPTLQASLAPTHLPDSLTKQQEAARRPLLSPNEPDVAPNPTDDAPVAAPSAPVTHCKPSVRQVPEKIFGPKYSDPISQDQDLQIRKLIQAVATWSLGALWYNEKALKEQGKQLEATTHPLRFLEKILCDRELNEWLKTIRKRWTVGTEFINGFVKRLKAAENRHDLAEHIHEFCQQVGVSRETVEGLIQEKKYEDLIYYLIDNAKCK